MTTILDLPFELFEQICAILLAHDYIESLLSLSCVCTQLRRWLDPADALWRQVLAKLANEIRDWPYPERGFHFNDDLEHVYDTLKSFPQPLLATCECLNPRHLVLSFVRAECSLVHRALETFTERNVGVAKIDIARWERVHSVQMPRILRRLYALSDGGTARGGGVQFLPLDEIVATPRDIIARYCEAGMRAKVAAIGDDPELRRRLEEQLAMSLDERLLAPSPCYDVLPHGIDSRSIVTALRMDDSRRCMDAYRCFAKLPGSSEAHAHLFVNVGGRSSRRFQVDAADQEFDYRRFAHVFASDHSLAVFYYHQDYSGNGGWLRYSFAHMPESLHTWFAMLATTSVDDIFTFGAIDVP
jgi:hypothetical protein